MPETICSLTPEIKQYFDSSLLSYLTPKFCDDSETLMKIYHYINKKLYKKCLNNPNKVKKFELLFEEFMRLYGRVVEKEREYKEKTGEDYQRPFDYFKDTSRYHKGLFGRLSFKS